MLEINAKEFLEFAVSKDLTYLYKRLLEELEELRNKREFMLEKLSNELPSEWHSVVRAVDYLDDKEFQYRRKKILDAGNDAKRNILAQLDKFKVEFEGKQV